MIKFSDDELELLPNQGHCNLNYLLKKGDKKYHVRKFKLADRDRVLEFKIQKLAYKKGVAAKPIYLAKEFMIGGYIEGVHKKKLSKKEIRKLAKSIKKLHHIKLRQKPIKFPTNIIQKAKNFKEELVLCHGDLNIKNIFFTKTVKFIDWEYAGINDKYFDLASICKEFEFNKRDENYFLKVYGDKINFKKLKAYKDIYEVLYKQWFEKLEKGELPFKN